MKRSELIKQLSELYNSIPRIASSYHVVDILIGKAERLGMKPPWHERKLTAEEAENLTKNDPNGLIYYDTDIIGEYNWEQED